MASLSKTNIEVSLKTPHTLSKEYISKNGLPEESARRFVFESLLTSL